jgi:hypothetical protein
MACQTGSGKTHTMVGSRSDPGVCSRTLQALLLLLSQRAAARPDLHWIVTVSAGDT